MIVYYNPNHIQHNPPFEVFNGDHDTAQEIPDRALNIKRALEKSGFHIEKDSVGVPGSLLARVHNKDYLSFIRRTSSSLQAREYLYPSVHPYQIGYTPNPTQLHPVAMRGQYIFDTYTPILHHTYNVALQSASLSYTGAKHIKNNPQDVVYALCRPPGHHAERAMAGGYCYINNAAVAAEYLSTYGKVAVLDVDFHHGNGTQHIFYARNDVLTVSIHANPQWKFPYYSGHEDELGTDKGRNFNLNIPLNPGTTDRMYDRALHKALSRIDSFKPKFLVVSYGADTHESDPIGGFKLTTEYYTKMANQIKSLNKPTLVVQEGGYNNDQLGTNVASFLKGFV